MKIPLAEAAREVSSLLAIIETSDEISDDLIPVFQTASEDVRTAVDRRIAFLRHLASEIDLIGQMQAGLAQRKKRLEKIDEKVRARTLDVIKQNPEIRLEGTLGSIYEAKSPQGVKYNTVFQSPIANVIDPSDIGKFPAEFVSSMIVYVLNKPEFEKSLKAGKITCEAAELGERGTHVRIK